MNIKYDSKSNLVEFCTLSVGDVFMLHAESDPYLKIEEEVEMGINAVNLKEPLVVYIAASDYVVLVEATLTVSKHS